METTPDKGGDCPQCMQVYFERPTTGIPSSGFLSRHLGLEEQREVGQVTKATEAVGVMMKDEGFDNPRWRPRINPALARKKTPAR